jgi:hypothetical protein
LRLCAILLHEGSIFLDMAMTSGRAPFWNSLRHG